MTNMERSDIILLASLAALFCWTYVVLPLLVFPK